MISCTIKRKDDLEKIAETGPWNVKENILNQQKWKTKLTMEEIDFSRCNFWVQVHNLPPNRMNRENAMILGNYVGKYIRCDEGTNSFVPNKFIRL